MQISQTKYIINKCRYLNVSKWFKKIILDTFVVFESFLANILWGVFFLNLFVMDEVVLLNYLIFLFYSLPAICSVSLHLLSACQC